MIRLLTQNLHDHVIKSLGREINSPGSSHYLTMLHFRTAWTEYRPALLAWSLIFLPECCRSFPETLKENFNKWIYKVAPGSRYFANFIKIFLNLLRLGALYASSKYNWIVSWLRRGRVQVRHWNVDLPGSAFRMNLAFCNYSGSKAGAAPGIHF